MLLIEKVVKLLDSFHFGAFREYVKNISKRSYYPLALLDVISRELETEQSSEELFRKTYGDEEIDDKAMKKFFQLAHYTFRLTGFLANNYPDYLQPNISRIQQLINTGQLEKAGLLLDMALDISQKTEDMDTELKLLNILIQREVLQESARQAQPHHERIARLLEWKQSLNEILQHLHTHFRAKGKPPEGMELEPHLAFFRQYHQSDSFAVRITSRFCSCFARYFVKDASFYTEETFRELEELEKELEKSPHIVLPYLFTINHRLSLLKLNYRLREMESANVLKEASQIIDDSRDILYWNSFINLPEIFSIAVQTSHYLSNYMISYKEGHVEMLSEEVREEIAKLRALCRSYLDNPELEQRFTLRYINLTYMYAGLLLLGSEQDIRESIHRLNSLLLAYQQVPFHAFIDPVYTILILGHFALREYDQVSESFNRYKKATKGKAVNPENDLTINGFYYLGKWLETGRNQYLNKLERVLEETQKPNLTSTRNLLLEAAEYFKMPLSLPSFGNN